MNRDLLLADLVRDEDLRLAPYRCSEGFLTTGIGRNLDSNPLTAEERAEIGHNGRSAPITTAQAYYLAGHDIDKAVSALDRNIPWWRAQPEGVQRVLANMCFNMGIRRLLGFRKALLAIHLMHYSAAADELLDSVWAKQVKARAYRLASIVSMAAVSKA